MPTDPTPTPSPPPSTSPPAPTPAAAGPGSAITAPAAQPSSRDPNRPLTAPIRESPTDRALGPLRHNLLTTFRLGHLRPFPGTWGSMPTAAVAWLMLLAGLGPATGDGASWLYHLVLLAILVVFTAACILFGDIAEAVWRKDPSQVVADETAGMCLPLLFLPAWTVDTAWEATAVVIAAFVLFRAFDIVKPWPAGRLQSLPAGWGIVVDDLVAGAMALVVMQMVLRAF